jgi:hypothetical protein
LADHAKGVGDELTAIVASLVEATDLVKAGGAEMQAVAEMFLGAVDKYREANDQWMETLGKIEDTLAKEAREEAGDLLGDYIEQSRELFDQSLQFQRELFSEFRALRQSRDSMVVPAAGE